MESVLVVDDDKISRQGIIFLLKSMNRQFKIFEANNGQNALEIIRQEPIDYLLTDIKMPFMDGLELIKQAFAINDHLGTIIFSGYSLFDYAKQAITLGVQEYILKPVDPSEFYSSMEKLIEERKMRIQSQAKENFNAKLINEHLLMSVINGRTAPCLAAQYPDVDVPGYLSKYKNLISIYFDEDFFTMNFNLDIAHLTSIPFFSLNINPNETILFLEAASRDCLIALANSIINFVSVKFSKTCFVAISTIKDSDYTASVDELEDLLESRYYLPHTQVLYHGDVIDSKFQDLEFEAVFKAVKNDIRLQDCAALRTDIHKYFKNFVDSNQFSTEYFKFTFATVIREIAQSIPELTSEQLNQRIIAYYHARNVKDIEKVIELFIEDLQVSFNNQTDIIHKEIETVQKYIYTHYSQDISVDMLADLVCLAPSYLSHIFKKETGINLSKFIKAYRMEKAKELLENSHEKIISVANSVGYPNVSYFCQSFRDFYGISPQKFRNTGLINE